MKYICGTSVYRDWRGIAGNYILLLLFICTAIINLIIAILTKKTMENKNKFPNYLFIILFCSNMMLAISQVVITLMRLDNDLNCTSIMASYIIHQMGMVTGSSGLLVMIVLHYKHIMKPYTMCKEEKKTLRCFAVFYLILSNVIGIIFVIIPIVWEHQAAFSFLMFYQLLINIFLIVYCWKDIRALLRRLENQTPLEVTYLKRLKVSLSYLKPCIIMTAFLRLYYIVLTTITEGLNQGNRGGLPTWYVVMKWITMLHYLTYFLMPVFIALKKVEIWNAITCYKRIGLCEVSAEGHHVSAG